MNKLSDSLATSTSTPPGVLDLVVLDLVERPVITTPIVVEIPDFQNT